MATLSKHGELGQIERLLDKVAYCADGKILRNTGSGWKQWRKLKPSFDMAVEWPKKQAAYLQRLRDDPYYADYRELLHKLVSFQNRPIVHETIANLGNDVDGCWSELQDYDSMHGSEIGLSVQELQDLADAYQGITEHYGPILDDWESDFPLLRLPVEQWLHQNGETKKEEIA